MDSQQYKLCYYYLSIYYDNVDTVHKMFACPLRLPCLENQGPPPAAVRSLVVFRSSPFAPRDIPRRRWFAADSLPRRGRGRGREINQNGFVGNAMMAPFAEGSVVDTIQGLMLLSHREKQKGVYYPRHQNQKKRRYRWGIKYHLFMPLLVRSSYKILL